MFAEGQTEERNVVSIKPTQSGIEIETSSLDLPHFLGPGSTIHVLQWKVWDSLQVHEGS